MANRGAVRLVRFVVAGFLAIAAACSSSRDSPAPKTASASIGPKGGQILVAGVELDVPAGALPTATTISIAVDSTSPPGGYEAVSPLIRFSPDGLIFAQPATVTLTATSQVASAHVYWSQPAGPGYDELPTTWQGAKATAQVSHFSSGFVGSAIVDAGIGGGDAGSVDLLTSTMHFTGTITGPIAPATDHLYVALRASTDPLGTMNGQPFCSPTLPNFRLAGQKGAPPSLPAAFSFDFPPAPAICGASFEVEVAQMADALDQATVPGTSVVIVNCGRIGTGNTGPGPNLQSTEVTCNVVLPPLFDAGAPDAGTGTPDAGAPPDAGTGGDAGSVDLAKSPMHFTGTITGPIAPATASIYLQLQARRSRLVTLPGSTTPTCDHAMPALEPVTIIGIPATQPITYAIDLGANPTLCAAAFQIIVAQMGATGSEVPGTSVVTVYCGGQPVDLDRTRLLVPRTLRATPCCRRLEPCDYAGAFCAWGVRGAPPKAVTSAT